jgi:fructose-bisphosphate aldolase class 1
MNAQELIDTAGALVADDKGLLAMDDSNPTCNKRFARLGIPQTKETRRAYRELMVTAPGLGDYAQMGACFAKWRAVIAVGDYLPSRVCIEANAQALARYAALCQEAGRVPVVEPEVLMDGGSFPAQVGIPNRGQTQTMTPRKHS